MEHTCIKKTIILKATDILAVQMLKFIGSFYWLYKALNTHYEYKSTVHVQVWYRKMCISDCTLKIKYIISYHHRDLMGNCQSSYITYINMHVHIKKKIVDMKTGFLRIF